MSLDHIETLHNELPEVFQDRDVGENWYDDIVVLPVTDPEKVTTLNEDDSLSIWPSNSDRIREPLHDEKEPPEGDILEEIGPDLIPPNGIVPDLSPVITAIFGGSHSGAPVPYTHQPFTPPPECLAFYLPFHYYYPKWWGVYLTYEGVLWLAGEILRLSGHSVPRLQAFQSARLFLYYHEAFHHKVECFATRLELTHRRPFYKTGFERYYQNTLGTVDCLEEGLGNSSALKDSYKKVKSKAVDAALAEYVKLNPPGYDRGNIFRPIFMSVRCRLAEDSHRMSLPHMPRKNPELWRTTPHLFDGVFNINGRVNYILPRNSSIAKRLPFRPCLSPKKLTSKLQKLVALQLVRQGANHEVWKTPTERIVEIPRHPRDLGRGLLRKILKEVELTMGLDEFLSLQVK